LCLQPAVVNSAAAAAQEVWDTNGSSAIDVSYNKKLTDQFGLKTSLDLNEARDDGVLGWQWHQLDHMQTICTSLQTDISIRH